MDCLQIEHKDIKKYKNIKKCLYVFTSPSGKHYIGITNNLYKRYKDHKRNGKSQYKTKFYDAIKKYKFENFKVKILHQDIEDRELLNFLEVLYIEKYKTQDSKFGYNINPGGDGIQLFGEANGMYGKTHTEESRQKMKDNRTPNYGHTHNRGRIMVYDINGKRFKVYPNDEKFLSGELKIKEPKPKILKSEEEKKENVRLGHIKRKETFANKSQEEIEAINASKALKGENNGRANIYVLTSPDNEIFEICLNENLQKFAIEKNISLRHINDHMKTNICISEMAINNNCINNIDYVNKVNNSIGWKINKYRRKDYEVYNR